MRISPFSGKFYTFFPVTLFKIHQPAMLQIVSISVRKARTSDIVLITDFNARMALETERKKLDLNVLRRGVTAVISNPAKGTYYVAESDGEVVGQTLVTYEWSDWRNGTFWWIQSVYVLPAEHRPDRPISENAILALLARMGYKGRMTGHGVRTIASTWAHEHGYLSDAVEFQLSHVPENKVKSAYNRATHLPLRRKMMEDFSAWLNTKLTDAQDTSGR